jgi:very-short-patch-repair endonuclease
LESGLGNYFSTNIEYQAFEFPLLFEGGVAGSLINKELQSLSPAGVVGFLHIFIPMKNHNIFNRKKFKSFRKSLRIMSTSAEATLWGILKSKKLDGRKFRRQHGIGNYIVDFCCPSEKLVIELDGDQHGDSEQIEKDERRDKYLEGLGFTVLRFENKFVFRDQDYITEEIRKIFNKGDQLTTPAGDNVL